jgi:hypothetical protein
MHNCYYWISWSQSVFRKQVAVLREVITERVLPTFTSIENEADAISDKTWERLGEEGGPYSDPARDAELAENAGLTHYLYMVDARQGLLNLFAVALHHLFEQQQLTVLRQELIPRGENPTEQILKVAEFVKRLRDSGIDAETFTSWHELQELRNVANVVKHADGPSANWLRSHRPEIFTPPSFRGTEKLFVPNPIRWPFQPLSGQDLYITADNLERYFRAVEKFWREFEEILALKAQTIN